MKKIGFVGLGAATTRLHMPVLSGNRDVEVCCACEPDQTKRQKFSKKYGSVAVFSSSDEMYMKSSLDAVFICTPDAYHFAETKKALEHNVNVFCEKPMGTSSQEAERLVELAGARGLRLAVGYNHRFHQTFSNLKKSMNTGMIGKVLQLHCSLVNPGHYFWKPDCQKELESNKEFLIYDNVSHLVDLVHYLLEDKIIKIHSILSHTLPTKIVNDNIVSCFETEKGVLGTISVAWNSLVNDLSVSVHGTGGSILASKDRFETFGASEDSLDKIFKKIREVRQLSREPVKQNLGHEGLESYFLCDLAFLSSLDNPNICLPTGKDALEVHKVLEMISRNDSIIAPVIKKKQSTLEREEDLVPIWN